MPKYVEKYLKHGSEDLQKWYAYFRRVWSHQPALLLLNLDMEHIEPAHRGLRISLGVFELFLNFDFLVVLIKFAISASGS